MSTENCVKHMFDLAEGMCHHCGHAFCERCLVFAQGKKKPPLCVSCAIGAAGIRTTAGNRPLHSAREIRKLERKRRKAEREAEGPIRLRRPTLPPVKSDPNVIPPPTRTVPSRSPAAGWTRAN